MAGRPAPRIKASLALCPVLPNPVGERRFRNAAIGEGHVDAANVVKKLVHAAGGEEAANEDIAETTPPLRKRSKRRSADPGVVVKGVDDVWVKLARCCTPVPGDPGPRAA